jgi:hypothetical protein
MPHHVSNIQQLVKQDGRVHSIVDRLSDQLIARARDVVISRDKEK